MTLSDIIKILETLDKETGKQFEISLYSDGYSITRHDVRGSIERMSELESLEDLPKLLTDLLYDCDNGIENFMLEE